MEWSTASVTRFIEKILIHTVLKKVNIISDFLSNECTVKVM